MLYAEHEAHGTWIENRPGLYFETESTRIIGPPRMLLALDMLAAALLGEFALALTRSGRPNERRSDYQRLMLTESATPADVVDRINDNPTITHAAVLATCAQAKPSCCNKTENYAYDDTIPAGRCSRIASSAPPPISRVHNVSRQDC